MSECVLCPGTFMTALKFCKLPHVKQKILGATIFKTLNPDFVAEDDDSGISAVFRGVRNIEYITRINAETVSLRELVNNVSIMLIPLIDENKKVSFIKSIKKIISLDTMKNDTKVELINNIRKQDLLQMNEFVFDEFLAGILLYVVKNVDNMHRNKAVRLLKENFDNWCAGDYSEIAFKNCYKTTDFINSIKVKPCEILYSSGQVSIDVISMDIIRTFDIALKTESVNVVIPVNTSFDTLFFEKRGVTKIELVSEKTLHGQWLRFMNDNYISSNELDKKINDSLTLNNVKSSGNNCRNAGKKLEYPIGSIAIVESENVKYFLVAISKFDNTNRARSDVINLEEIVENILETYDIEGQGFDLYVPLLGSGRSRMGITLQDSYETLKELLLMHSKKIYGNIHLVINPDQLGEIKMEEK